jgi:hypothetical protein
LAKSIVFFAIYIISNQPPNFIKKKGKLSKNKSSQKKLNKIIKIIYNKKIKEKIDIIIIFIIKNNRGKKITYIEKYKGKKKN